ncbi:MAG: succinate dehydrogenase assembly factor 2 [Mariprofundaceae bacterium]|nr:succinate dehydrogenase assembly factor 2 [Mariprofundaceae bacterium]
MSFDIDSQAADLRKIRYRIRRLGMLELEVWLARLQPALADGDAVIFKATLQLLELETPVLVCMMNGEQPVPAPLRAWLAGSA